MKVYVLHFGRYDEDGLVGVYSSKEKAIEAGLKKCDPIYSGPRYTNGAWVIDKIHLTSKQVESRIEEYELEGEE